MNKKYHVKIIQQGNIQTLLIPPELYFSTSEVTIRSQNGQLIIEPDQKKSLLEVLASLEPWDDNFPDVDEGLLPLDNIEL